jgi:anti-sigma B factor antagonist
MRFAADARAVDDEAWLVTVSGEADVATAPAVSAALDRALSAGARSITLDLTDATFVDSTVLGLFIDACRCIHQRQGRFSVQSDDRNVRKVFMITGVDRVLGLNAPRGARE